MSWICPKCNLRNVNVNEHCADSKCRNNREEITDYDNFDELLSEIRLFKGNTTINLYLSKEWKDKPVTPQEELFAELFNKHINILHPLVKDMDLLEIRAYRERMSLIAAEGKAAVYAADQSEKEVLKFKNKDNSKITGFARSVNIDETSTNAINTIKERQKKLTAKEKIQASLEKLGISTADAEKLMSAGTIKAKLEDKNEVRGPLTGGESFVVQKLNNTNESDKPLFNPFEKKGS